MYAIPCAFGHPSDPDDIEMFFITFHTRDERLAEILAGCICGVENAENALIMLNEDGDIFHL